MIGWETYERCEKGDEWVSNPKSDILTKKRGEKVSYYLLLFSQSRQSRSLRLHVVSFKVFMQLADVFLSSLTLKCMQMQTFIHSYIHTYTHFSTQAVLQIIITLLGKLSECNIILARERNMIESTVKYWNQNWKHSLFLMLNKCQISCHHWH